MIDFDRTTKVIGAISATFAMITGGYSFSDKLGWFKKPVLEWSPEHFSISSGPANGSFDVVVARKKFRDDCSVEEFALEVRDAKYMVHKATSSVAKFSGPATKDVDKFGYAITLPDADRVSAGTATLLAHIRYKCPEGERVVQYPRHTNLSFELKG
jgi:hypothetical protein